MRLTVLEIDDDDMAAYLGAETVGKLKEHGLFDAAMYQARKYMWDYIDNSDFYWDCINDGAKLALRGARQ